MTDNIRPLSVEKKSAWVLKDEMDGRVFNLRLSRQISQMFPSKEIVYAEK